MSAAPRRGGKRPPEPEVEPDNEEQGLPPPFSLQEGVGASVSLGLDDVPGVGMLILPWIAIERTQMKGADIMMSAGKLVIYVKLSYKRIEVLKWEVSKIIEGIHSQKLAWLRHQPEQGISLRVEEKSDDEE